MPGPNRPQSASSSRIKEKDTEFPNVRSLRGVEVIHEGRPFTRSQCRARQPGIQGEAKESIRPLNFDKSAGVKASHASISLLTPREKTLHLQDTEAYKPFNLRRTSLADCQASPMEVDHEDLKFASTLCTDKDLMTPQVNHVFSPQVLAAYNWVKERETSAQITESVPYGSAKPPLTRSRVPFSVAKAEPMSTLKSPVLRDLNSVGKRGRQAIEVTDRNTAGDDGSGSRIMVYLRLRPMSKKEKESGARSCVKIANKRDVYLTEFALETDYLRLKRLRGRHFAFDAAFPDNTSQQEVYTASTAGLVEAVLQGKNGSVFCYGATGAGKTYTMLGTVQQPGVMVLALRDLFAKMKQRSHEGDYLVRLSYLEVYNESVRDLLSPGRPLVLREDSRQGIVAAGLTQYQAYSADEVMSLLQKGNMNRQTEPTRMNETSSRSHAILQVVVEYQVQQDAGKVLRVGKLSLIDLAGSERALASDQRTARSVEGANINRSLLALSSCINALVEGKKHIPFRNSKLTQLLKDSLGGACLTAMVANLSPSNGSFGETQNTLHWADRAKEIRTKVCEAHEELQQPDSQDDKSKLLMQIQKENQQLRLQLSLLQQKNAATQSTVENASPQKMASPFTPIVNLDPAIAPSSVGRIPIRPSPLHETISMRVDSEGTLQAKKIWQLQRTVQLLEIEAEKSRRDSAAREKKLTASIKALTHEHNLQLKHKDDFIRNLSLKTPGASEQPSPVVSPSKCLEQPTALKNYCKPTVASTGMNAERIKKRFVTPKPPKAYPTQPPSAVRTVVKTEHTTSRVTRKSSKTQAPPIDEPTSSLPKTPLPRFCSPSKIDENSNSSSSGKKRTFWDITNSPVRPINGKCTRLSSATPSMLLQPGFVRRRMSQGQY